MALREFKISWRQKEAPANGRGLPVPPGAQTYPGDAQYERRLLAISESGTWKLEHWIQQIGAEPTDGVKRGTGLFFRPLIAGFEIGIGPISMLAI